jgi:CDGSH-type Zn-finger protein
MVRTRQMVRNTQEEATNLFALMSKGKGCVSTDDLIEAAKRAGEIPAGDLASEAKWRAVFDSVIAGPSNRSAPPELDQAAWNRVMRESVSDKRHRQPNVSLRDTDSYDIKTRAKVAKRGPFGSRVEAGQTYYICTCGMSKRQPYCDGSHTAFNADNGTNFQPSVYRAEETKTVWFCGCKQSQNMPLCDGTHTTLPTEDGQ